MSKNPEVSSANTSPEAAHNELGGDTPFMFSTETLALLFELRGSISAALENAVLTGRIDAVHRLSEELPSSSETLSVAKLIEMMERYGEEPFKLMMLLKTQAGKLKVLLERDINRSQAAVAAIHAAVGAQAVQSLQYFERDALTDNP